jgi:hypothetical protein
VIVPLLLALAVAADTVGAAPAPALTPAPAPERLDGWRHELAVGAHTTNFASREGSHYAFHSATLGYAGSVGAVGAFLHLSALLPLQARQDGAVYATANYYRRRSGADLLVGPQKRWSLGWAELEAGPGLHATLISLPGRPGYRDFSALPMGLGAGAVLRWKTGAERLSRAVNLGTSASLAYDLRDPAHANDLSHGFTFRVAVAVGLGARR